MRMADRHLVDKCLNGDSAAFGMLVDRYKESVYALAYSKLRNFHDAEDITQEAFTKAYQKLRTLRRWDEFYAWIYAITSNLCKNWIKASARRPDREFIADHSASSLSRYSTESHNEESMLEVLHEALDSLPESYQQVLTLHYLGGMDGTEIAEFLGKSPSAIWQRLSRARASLKKEILDMMSETYEQNRLRSGFTFSVMEMLKRIRIDPVPPRVWPWGLSIASGIIIGVLCIGMNVNLINTESYTSISSLSGESMAQKVGEFPVDVMKVSDISVTSDQHLPGNGLGNVVASMQNALFMAPQAEGGTWTKKANMPTRRESLASAEVNGKIYAIGGNSPNGRLSTLEEYDPVADEWTRKADMPTDRSSMSANVVSGKIYVIGGCRWNGKTIASLSIVEEYDPVLDKWTRKSDMPTPRQVCQSSSVVDGKIYVIGGYDAPSGKRYSTVEVYDPASDTWEKRADMPTARYASACAFNGKIYVIGGLSNDRQMLSTVEEYDPTTDIWTKKADISKARYKLSSSSVNGKIYAIGGYNGLLGGQFSLIEEYDPLTGKWIEKTSMPTARSGFTTSVVNGKIYAIGGDNAGFNMTNILSTVEEYDPELSNQNIEATGKLPTTWSEVRTALRK